MGSLYFNVPEIHTRVTDPIALQIIESILRNLDVYNYFQGAITLKSDRHALSTQKDDQGRPRVSNDRCDVLVEPMLNPANVRWERNTQAAMTAYWQNMKDRYAEDPVFYDETADVVLRECTVPAGIVLEFTMKFNTIDGATKAVNAIISKYRGEGTPVAHDVVYTYPLDMNLLDSLYAVFERKGLPPNTNFIDYLRNNSGASSMIDVEVARELVSAPPAEQRRQLVVRKRQLNAMAVLEYTESKPEAEKVEQYLDRAIVRFTYTLQFARPSVLWLTFPTVVNNELLPGPMFDKNAETFVDALSGIYGETAYSRFMRSYYAAKQEPSTVIRFPEYDEWNVPAHSKVAQSRFNSFFVVGLLLDEGGGCTQDLKDVCDYQLHPRVRDLMQLHVQRGQLQTTYGLYNVSVFENDMQIDSSRITISSDLVMSLTATNKERRYHLVFSEATDASRLDQFWLNQLVQNRCLFPSTVAENLKTLTTLGVYRIVASHALLSVIRMLMDGPTVATAIAWMISETHATPEIWEYTFYPEQLFEYLSMTKSAKSGSRCYLYEIFVQKLVDMGAIDTASQIPPRSLVPTMDHIGYKGLRYGCNFPLRVFNAVIAATRGTGAS